MDDIMEISIKFESDDDKYIRHDSITDFIFEQAKEKYYDHTIGTE